MTIHQQNPSTETKVTAGADSASARVEALYNLINGTAGLTVVAQTPRNGGPDGSYAFAFKKDGENYEILITCDNSPAAPGNNIFVQLAPNGGITDAAAPFTAANISSQVGPIPATVGTLSLGMGVSIDDDCVNILFMSMAKNSVPYMIRAGVVYTPHMELDDLTGLGILAGIPRVSADLIGQAGAILSVSDGPMSRAFHLGGSNWSAQVTTSMTWDQVSREATMTTGSNAHAVPITIKRRVSVDPGPIDTWAPIGALTGLRVVPGAVGIEGHGTLSRAPRTNAGSYLILSPDPAGPGPNYEKLGLPWGDLDLAA